MRKQITAVSFAALMAASGAAMAGWYGGVEAGANMVPDTDLTSADWASYSGADYHTASFDDNAAFVLKGGYQAAGSPVAYELELSWRSNDVDQFGPYYSGTPGYWSAYDGAGKTSVTAGMINAVYNFDTGSKLQPHVGVGVGVADVKREGIRRNIGPSDCCTAYVDGSDTVLAVQAILGLNYQINPKVALLLNYRYLLTEDAKFNWGAACSADGTGCSVNGTGKESYDSHMVTIGLRYDF